MKVSPLKLKDLQNRNGGYIMHGKNGQESPGNVRDFSLASSRTLALLGCGASLFLLSCTSTPVRSPQAEAPGQVISTSSSRELKNGRGRSEVEFTEITARVKAVDKKKRTLTVVGPNGNKMTLDVDPAVKRFDEVKPGDEVFVQVIASLAFEVREPTAEEKKHPKIVVNLAGKNSASLPPGAAAARSVHAIVKIIGIDRGRESVTLKGPEGRVFEVKVADPKNLEKVKLGDTIAVTYTEGLAVGLSPAS